MSTSDPKPSPGPASSDLERMAAEWVLRRQLGLTPRERADLQQWLGQDPCHAEIFAEMAATSALLDRLHDPALARHPDSIPPIAAFDPARPVPRRRWLAPAGLAAAAALVLGLAAWQASSPGDSYVQSAATEIGGQRTLNLPDGSVVQLNTDTALEVNFSSGARQIQLSRGEAFFTVAPDPGRPFLVEAQNVAVRAVGTAFNVRYRPDAVEVLVKEGKVSVNLVADESAGPGITGSPSEPSRPPALEPRMLVAGQRARVASAFDASQIAPVVVAALDAPRIESALAWQARRLEFSDTPLSEVVAEFNRYNRHQLVIADPELGRQTFGGAFASDGYPSLVEVLELGFRVVAETRGGTTTLRQAP